MKNIPKKNYLILTLILLIVVGITFYARSWYITAKEYYSNNSAVKDVVQEINEIDIGSYVIETPNFILYTSSGTNSDLKNFEKEFKELITQLDIQNNVIYLNLDNVNVNAFTNSLKEKYSYNEKISNQISDSSYSSIYIFTNGKIKYVLNNASEYSSSYIKSLLESQGYKND